MASHRLKIGVGTEWAGHHVAVIRRGDEATILSTDTGEIIRQLTLDPTWRYQGTGRPKGGPMKARRPRPTNV